MTDTPDLRTLAADIPDELVDAAARAQLAADNTPNVVLVWDRAPEFIRQAYRARARAGLAAVLPAHRRQVLEEAAEVLAQDALCNEDTRYDSLAGAAVVVRRLASAAPETAPSPRQDDETAPVVGREAAQAQGVAQAAVPGDAEQVVQHRVVMGTIEGTWAEISDEDAARQIAETQGLGLPPWRMERRVVSIGPAEVIGHGGRSTGAAAAGGQDDQDAP